MKKKHRLLLLAAILLCAAAYLAFWCVSYHADDTAKAALASTDRVIVSNEPYGWFFDGPSEDSALAFYPGALVQETAYAPLLKGLAEGGLDVCLIDMPFHMAILSPNKARVALQRHSYAHWYVGGHSLGGAMAARFAQHNAANVEGVVLLAAYPEAPLDPSLAEIMIYGTEDGVLNMQKAEAERETASPRFTEHIIQGGNHAQFGCYGEQRGDGAAAVTAKAQQRETIDAILAAIGA